MLLTYSKKSFAQGNVFNTEIRKNSSKIEKNKTFDLDVVWGMMDVVMVMIVTNTKMTPQDIRKEKLQKIKC